MADSFIADALMGLGQGLTGQPYLTNFDKLKQDASQWRDKMQQQQIQNQQEQQKINISQSQANNQLGQNAIYMSAMSGGAMTPAQYMAAMNTLNSSSSNQSPGGLPPGPGSPNVLPQAPTQPQIPPGAMMSMASGPNTYGDASGKLIPSSPSNTTPVPNISQTDPTQFGLSAIQAHIQSMGLMPEMVNGKLSFKPAYGALPADQVQDMAQQLVDRKLVPSQLSTIRGAGKAQLFAAAQKIDHNYNPSMVDMNYAVQKTGASAFQKNFNNLDSFSRDFDKNSDYLLTLSSQLPRSSWPLINNALINGAQNITGDPKATQFVQTMNTVANGYARLQNPSLSGQALSDASRAEAKDVANKLMSGVQVDALFNPQYGSMRVEQHNRIDAAKEVLNNINGGSSKSTSSSSTNTLQSLKDKYGLK